MKFVCRKFLRGADESSFFIEDLLDGMWSFRHSTKTSFKLSLPKKEMGKEWGGDVDNRESCVDTAMAVCTSAEGGVRMLGFVFL